jgi:hypothetical protein
MPRATMNISFFSGFYHSIWSESLDHEESQWAEYEAEYRQAEDGIDERLRLSQDDLANIIWKCSEHSAGYRDICRAYVPALNELVKDETGIDLRLAFESMDSPREYNFTTDRLYALIPWRMVRRMFRDSKKEKHATLARMISERFTSRDGFISFYKSALAPWLAKPLGQWDHNELGTLFAAWLALRGVLGEDERIENRIYDQFGSEVFYSIWSDSVDWKKYELLVAERRAEIYESLGEQFAADYTPPPYRCPATLDLFKQGEA